MNPKKIFTIILLVLNISLIAICIFTKSMPTLSFNNSEDVKKQIEQVKKSVVSLIAGINKDTGFRTGDIAVGTGLVYNDDGYIVTNYHNVKDKSFFVVTYDNKKYSAKLVAGDVNFDIAIVKVEDDRNELIPAKFGDSKKCNVGDKVLAIGTALSTYLKDTVATGIISGTNRTGFGNYKLIQSDIAFSPGFSGGPLINLNGEVIGINSLKSNEYGSEGLAFSIPSENVLYAISKLEEDGKITVPYLGIKLAENSFTKYGIPSNEGLIVNSIDKNSSASKAGLTINDKILSINNTKISNIVEYNEVIKNLKIGDEIGIKVIRDNKELDISVKIEENR